MTEAGHGIQKAYWMPLSREEGSLCSTGGEGILQRAVVFFYGLKRKRHMASWD